MIYRAIGLMSGSSLDGLDIVFTEIHENGGKWSYEILHADCYAYTEEWIKRLKNAISLKHWIINYCMLNMAIIWAQVNRFIDRK